MRSHRFISVFSILVLLLSTHAWAQRELLDSLLSVADADQVRAFRQLKLSEEQKGLLGQVVMDMVPKVQATKGNSALLFGLLPEAFERVDAVLTPEQRPLARKLVPRPHQWEKLKVLYEGFAKKREASGKVVSGSLEQ